MRQFSRQNFEIDFSEIWSIDSLDPEKRLQTFREYGNVAILAAST